MKISDSRPMLNSEGRYEMTIRLKTKERPIGGSRFVEYRVRGKEGASEEAVIRAAALLQKIASQSTTAQMNTFFKGGRARFKVVERDGKYTCQWFDPRDQGNQPWRSVCKKDLLGKKGPAVAKLDKASRFIFVNEAEVEKISSSLQDEDDEVQTHHRTEGRLVAEMEPLEDELWSSSSDEG